MPIFLFFIFCPVLYFYLILPEFGRKDQIKPFLKRDYAHRGLHDKAKGIPENTMPAFQAAIAQNLAIELDVHLTRDNKVVVFHDDDLKRLCGQKGSPERLTYAELQKYGILGTDEKMPLLSDVLELVDGKVPLLIELKLPGKDTRLCSYTWNLLKDYSGPYMVQSFNSLGVRWFRKHQPQVLRGQLSSNLTKTDKKNPYIARFLAKHLLTNVTTRPDFITYCIDDADNLSLWMHQHLFHTPTGAWTIRSLKQYQKAKKSFSFYIFEKFNK